MQRKNHLRVGIIEEKGERGIRVKKPFMWTTQSRLICVRKRKALGSLTEQGKTKKKPLKPKKVTKKVGIYSQKNGGVKLFHTSSIGRDT